MQPIRIRSRRGSRLSTLSDSAEHSNRHTPPYFAASTKFPPRKIADNIMRKGLVLLGVCALASSSGLVASPSAAQPTVDDPTVNAVPIEIDGLPVTVTVAPDERVELEYDYDGIGLVRGEILQCTGSYRFFFEMSGTRSRRPGYHCETTDLGPFEPRGPADNIIAFDQWMPDGSPRTYTISLKSSPVDVVSELVLGGEPVTIEVPASPSSPGSYSSAWLSFYGVEGQEISLDFSGTPTDCASLFTFRGELRHPDLATTNLQSWSDPCLDDWSGTLSQTGLHRIEMYSDDPSSPYDVTVSSSMQQIGTCADAGITPIMLVHGFNGTTNAWRTFEPELVDRVRREFRRAGLNHLDATTCGRQFVRSVNVGPRDSSYINAVPLADKIDAFTNQTGAERIDVIAHSKGGLDTRRAIRLLQAEITLPPRNLLMIATPNAGTPMADAACGIYNSPIGLASDFIEEEFGECDGSEDALYALTEEFVQNSFNPNTLDSTFVVYQTIAGASTCGRCRFFGPMMGDNDGLVPVSSVERFAPTGWHSPVGTFDATHSDLIHESAVIGRAHCSLTGRTPDPSDCIGEPGSAPTQVPPGAQETTNSVSNLAHFDTHEVPPADTSAVSLPIGGIGPAEVAVMVDQTGLTGTVGDVVLESEETDRGEVLTAPVESTTDVDLTLSNTGPNAATGLVLITNANVPSLEIDTPSIAVAGSPVDLTVPNADPVEGLTGTVTAPSGTRSELTFTTNGADATASFTPTEGGAHAINVFHSARFQRTAFRQLPVATGGATLPGTFTESLETGPDGLATALHLDVDVEVTEPDTYQLTGTLTSQNGAEVAKTEATAELAQGQQQIRLTAPGEILYGAGQDGPYNLELRLLRTNPDTEVETVEAQRPAASPTQSYTADGFQPATINAEYVALEQGDFDTAVAEVPVRLSEPITRPVTVEYTSLNPPGDRYAHFPEDFEAVSGTLTFRPGETEKAVPVTVNGNPEQEGNKIATIGLTNATRAAVGGSGRGGVAILVEPTAEIDTPGSDLTWSTGDEISFSGHVDDPLVGLLPASALSWRLQLQHCPRRASCHTHLLEEWNGVAEGSFIAPDHGYPSHLVLELTAEAAATPGLTHHTLQEIHPKTVDITLASDPSGRLLATRFPGLDGFAEHTPFTRTAIQGSTVELFALDHTAEDGTIYVFQSWSQGGPATQLIQAPATPTTYTATFAADVVVVDSPSSAAGQYPAIAAVFGPPPTEEGVAGNIVLVDDGSPNPTEGCNPLTGFPAGAIALIDRGTCPFTQKVLNAQNAGAVAVVVANNEPGGPRKMVGTDPGLVIPSVMVSLDHGNTIKAGLPATGSITRQ